MDGDAKSKADLQTAAGFPAALINTGSWTYEAYKLPGLGGMAVIMPNYLVPDEVAPTLSAVSFVECTSDAAGTVYYRVLNDGAATPTKETIAAGTNAGAIAAATATQISVVLTAGAKDVYVVVKDAADNISAASKIDFVPFAYAVTVTDGTGSGNYAPSATVTVTEGTATAGQRFKNWTASPVVTFANANSASTIFTMLQNAVTVTANYEAMPIDPNFLAGYGNGTQGYPFQITTAVKLAKLAELVNAGTAPYANEGVYYKLMNYLDLSAYGASYNSGKGWIPIGH